MFDNNINEKLLSYEEPSRFKKQTDTKYNHVSNIDTVASKLKKKKDTAGLVVSVIIKY